MLPTLYDATVVRILAGDRVLLRLSLWDSVELTVECRLPEVAFMPHRYDDARKAAVMLVGGKSVIARIDRRSGVPDASLFRAARAPIDGYMEAVIPGQDPMLDVNRFLADLAPEFDCARVREARGP